MSTSPSMGEINVALETNSANVYKYSIPDTSDSCNTSTDITTQGMDTDFLGHQASSPPPTTPVSFHNDHLVPVSKNAVPRRSKSASSTLHRSITEPQLHQRSPATSIPASSRKHTDFLPSVECIDSFKVCV